MKEQVKTGIQLGVGIAVGMVLTQLTMGLVQLAFMLLLQAVRFQG